MTEIKTVKTSPIEGQKPGTSGLRKKVKVFQDGYYLHNFVQSLFNVVGNDLKGRTLLVSGDGRYYNRTAIHIIAQIAAANGVAKLWVGKGGLVSTPAASCIVRNRNPGECGGCLILSASHNPGGPENDFGIKYNTGNGAPAPESITEKMFEETKKISEFKIVEFPAFDVDTLGIQYPIAGFEVEIIDPVSDWMRLMKQIFDFELLKTLFKNKEFKMIFDGLNGVAGPYAESLIEDLGGSPESLLRCKPLEDFGGLHPDPNLTYAPDLVERMKVLKPKEATPETPDFGAAGDGDNDRNMILGRGFFVTPSDSVAIIAAYAEDCIPYFKGGLKGVARSMPTSASLDVVAKALGIECYEVPTGWKFFANLMDAGKLSICGEESFGTGSDHVREKDGLWAVLAWLSIIAYRSQLAGGKVVSVEQIVKEHWRKYGRYFYERDDYEECDAEKSKELLNRLRSIAANKEKYQEVDQEIRSKLGELTFSDDFEYKDPIDKSVSPNQGVRFLFSSGTRAVFRLSGTGSSGATIRLYVEKYEKDVTEESLDIISTDFLKETARACARLAQIEQFTGRKAPTVIT
eukprot:GHVP01022301.1.p1 GENE.GHVP01022301.1~~GHVP01022301.1.p1  ORF type:complete len:574 (-),score=110.90 GHVP01022301.1:1322-3043(-)